MNEDFPAITRLLEGIQVECDKVIEKVTFHLSAENKYLGSEDVQRMTVTASGPLSSRKCS